MYDWKLHWVYCKRQTFWWVKWHTSAVGHPTVGFRLHLLNAGVFLHP